MMKLLSKAKMMGDFAYSKYAANVDTRVRGDSGLPDDIKEKYREAEYTIDLRQEGDTWYYNIKNTLHPEKTIIFKPGEEAVSDLLGKRVKFTITFETDSKMTQVEYSEMMDWKPMIITRDVKGNIIYNVIKLEDVEMRFEFNRCYV